MSEKNGDLMGKKLGKKTGDSHRGSAAFKSADASKAFKGVFAALC